MTAVLRATRRFGAPPALINLRQGETEMEYEMSTLADEQSTGPCENCSREAPFVGRPNGRPEFFCCACALEVTGEVSPNCGCGICEAERMRAQIEMPDCTCEICVSWRARQRRQ